MADPRYLKLAEIIVHHSCDVQENDKVLIETFDIPAEFTALLARQVAAAKGLPI